MTQPKVKAKRARGRPPIITPGMKNVPAVKTRENKSKYDWPKIRAAYIEGVPDDPNQPDGPRKWLGLDETAKLMGVNPTTMRNKSSEEKWADQRQSYKAAFAVQRQRQRMAKMVDEAVDFDDRALNVAKIGIGLITQRMAEIARDQAEKERKRRDILEKMRNGVIVDPTQLPKAVIVDADEMLTLARAAQTWHDIGQKSMGITDTARIEITGASGGPVDIRHNHTENLRDAGPDKIARAFALAEQIGLMGENRNALEANNITEVEPMPDDEDDVVDAEVVDEDVVDQEPLYEDDIE